MILAKFKHFLTNNKKVIIYFWLFVFAFLFSIDTTFAAEDNITNNIATVIQGILKGVSVFLGLTTYLATIFLSPEWINGSLFGLDVKFREIWILVSNLVYFVFAFILIWISFMNIVGKGNEQYQIKQALPRFIVGVLIVPFSWFFIQFMLSLSAVLTVAGLSLPFETFDEFKTTIGETKIPQSCEINLKSVFGTDTDTSDEATKFINCGDGNNGKNASELLDGDAIRGIFGIVSMYTYGLIGFDNLPTVDANDYQNVQRLGDLIVKIAFDLIFVLAYSILMITLGIVLMIRGVYIWIYIMMSPLFGLMYFLGKSKDGNGFFSKFNLTEFIGLCLVPVYTMLALSFGLLFIYVTGSGLTGNISQSLVTISQNGENSEIKIGEFGLTIIGAAAKDGNDTTGFLNKIGEGALGVVGALILKIFGLIILWGTVMTAMRQSEITKQITEPIYEFGKSVGKVAASGPGNLPIFFGQSANSMKQISGMYETKVGNIGVNKAQKMSENMPFLKNSGEFTGGIEKLKNSLSPMSSDNSSQLESAYKQLLALTKGESNNFRSAKFLEGAKAIGSKYLKKEEIDKMENKTERQVIETIIKPLEIKLESLGGGGDGLFGGVGGVGNLTDEDLIRIAKDFATGTASVSKTTPEVQPGVTQNNTINVTTNQADGKISSFTLSNKTINLRNNGEIESNNVNNFADAIKGKSVENLRNEFKNKKLDLDTLLKNANDELKSQNQILEVKNGVIELVTK